MPVFSTSHGTRRTFRVNNVDPDIPVSDLREAVDELLAHDIMSDTRGALVQLLTLTANTLRVVNPLAA